ncbi:MAG: hypothetical protein LUH05_06405 [Candidatus Gastranaerophilales bacterium]|nr:hypothetical protein [Candidatus Gastranaerophilales bacterium]
MKKNCLLIMSFICFCALTVYADSPCDSEMTMKSNSNYSSSCKKPCKKTYQNPCEPKCPQTYTPCASECFLCTNKNMNTLFKQIGLSETQICTAEKIQDKYELEVLSLNEKIHCEEQNMNSLKRNCATRSELRKQKNVIKKLKKTRKEICKCYEKQFKALLSDQQKRAYRKYKK